MKDNKERFFKWALVVCVVIMSLSLGHRALWDPDEGRYAEMAREILVLNDWVTPHLNNLPYFEKPMMFMWLEAISFKAFGVSEPAARLVPLLCALAGVFLVGLMAKSLWGLRASLIASLCLITSVEYLVLAVSADLNMALTLFITSAFVFFWLGHTEGKSMYLFLFWASMALATLTKGPIGFILPAGAIGLYILITRQFSLIREARPLAGILLYLVITLPWFVLVSMKNPDFLSFFIVNQNLQRYTISDEHNAPIYYFLIVILAGGLPWTFLLPSAMKRLWKDRMQPGVVYLTLWFAFIFCFFTLSHSKLATYVLPCFPPLALLLAHAFHKMPLKAGIPLYMAGALWSFIGIAFIVFPALVAHGFVKGSAHEMAPLMHTGLLMGGLIIGGVLAGIWVGIRRGSIEGIVLIGITIMIASVVFSPQWDSVRSTKALLEDLPANARLCAYGRYYPSSSFYAKRQVALVDYRGELEYGIRHNAVKDHVLSLDELSGLMESDPYNYCISQTRHLAGLKMKIPGITVVRQSGDLSLVHVPAR